MDGVITAKGDYSLDPEEIRILNLAVNAEWSQSCDCGKRDNGSPVRF